MPKLSLQNDIPLSHFNIRAYVWLENDHDGFEVILCCILQ